MKIRQINILILAITIVMMIACSGGETSDIDEEKPTFDLNYSESFPQTCSELRRGKTYQFRVRVADNIGLAAYSLNIHHNFDHHTHDNQGQICELSAIRQPVNPLIYIENFNIEGRPTNYEIIIPVSIPVDVDTGDYHCQFSVTDVTGWQGRTSIDIKILD